MHGGSDAPTSHAEGGTRALQHQDTPTGDLVWEQEALAEEHAHTSNEAALKSQQQEEREDTAQPSVAEDTAQPFVAGLTATQVDAKQPQQPQQPQQPEVVRSDGVSHSKSTDTQSHSRPQDALPAVMAAVVNDQPTVQPTAVVNDNAQAANESLAAEVARLRQIAAEAEQRRIVAEEEQQRAVAEVNRQKEIAEAEREKRLAAEKEQQRITQEVKEQRRLADEAAQERLAVETEKHRAAANAALEEHQAAEQMRLQQEAETEKARLVAEAEKMRRLVAEEEERRRAAEQEQEQIAAEVQRQKEIAEAERQKRVAAEAEQQRIQQAAAQQEQEHAAAEAEYQAAEAELQRVSAVEEEQRRQQSAAREETDRLRAEIEKHKSMAAEEEQRRIAAELEKQRVAEEADQQKQLAAAARQQHEEERAQLALEAQEQRRLAGEAEQRQAAEELIRQRRILEEETQKRLAAEKEQQRMAQEVAEQRRLAEHAERQRRVAEEEKQRVSAEAEQQRRMVEKEKHRLQEQLASFSPAGDSPVQSRAAHMVPGSAGTGAIPSENMLDELLEDVAGEGGSADKLLQEIMHEAAEEANSEASQGRSQDRIPTGSSSVERSISPGARSISPSERSQRSKSPSRHGADKKTSSRAKKKLNTSSYSEKQLGKYFQKLFANADKDGNGTLDRSELAELLGWSGFEFDVSSVEELMAVSDKNGDGVIDYMEFVQLMKAYCTADQGAVDAKSQHPKQSAKASRAGAGTTSSTEHVGASTPAGAGTADSEEFVISPVTPEADDQKPAVDSRVLALEAVFRAFDMDGSGKLGADEMLALGQARRDLGQKKGGPWTETQNLSMMRNMGVDAYGNVSMEDFVDYLYVKLTKDTVEFQKTIEQFLACAKSLNETKTASREREAKASEEAAKFQAKESNDATTRPTNHPNEEDEFAAYMRGAEVNRDATMADDDAFEAYIQAGEAAMPPATSADHHVKPSMSSSSQRRSSTIPTDDTSARHPVDDNDAGGRIGETQSQRPDSYRLPSDSARVQKAANDVSPAGPSTSNNKAAGSGLSTTQPEHPTRLHSDTASPPTANPSKDAQVAPSKSQSRDPSPQHTVVTEAQLPHDPEALLQMVLDVAKNEREVQGQLHSKVRQAEQELEKWDREQRMLETQMAMSKEAARKDRLATGTIESKMNGLAREAEAHTRLLEEEHKHESAEATDQEEMSLWLDVMSIELAHARAELEIYQGPRAPIVLYKWEELRHATRDFDARYALSAGTFGELYAAELAHHDQSVMVKKLEGGTRRCGFPEALQRISRYQHPHLMPILGLGISSCGGSTHEEDPAVCIVYSRIDGGSLADCLASHSLNALSPDQRIAVLAGVSAGLHFLHVQIPPEVHGDLKTSNVLVSSGKVARVTDYVLHLMYGESYSELHTRHGAFSQYTDPHAADTREFDLQGDVYSFGVIILEVLLGSLPPYPLVKFVAGLGDPVMLMQAVDKTCGAWTHDGAMLLQRLCAKCLHPDREQRPSFGQIHAQLMQHKDGTNASTMQFIESGKPAEREKVRQMMP